MTVDTVEIYADLSKNIHDDLEIAYTNQKYVVKVKDSTMFSTVKTYEFYILVTLSDGYEEWVVWNSNSNKFTLNTAIDCANSMTFIAWN